MIDIALIARSLAAARAVDPEVSAAAVRVAVEAAASHWRREEAAAAGRQQRGPEQR